MVQKFPESVPRLRHNTRKNISGEKQLNCALICIIVHINEAPAYEYSYFLFCCLIKKGEGGLIMTAPAVERNRSMADEWITTFETRFLDKRGGVTGLCQHIQYNKGQTHCQVHTAECTLHWWSRTSKTGKNYSSTAVELLHTMKTESASRTAYLSKRSTITGLPVDAGCLCTGSQSLQRLSSET